MDAPVLEKAKAGGEPGQRELTRTDAPGQWMNDLLELERSGESHGDDGGEVGEWVDGVGGLVFVRKLWLRVNRGEDGPAEKGDLRRTWPDFRPGRLPSQSPLTAHNKSGRFT